jgi:L-ascorbate metabolism protein UlaG (beta-lactamase superfamily)
LIQLEYLAHSCFRLSGEKTSVIFDPYGPEVGYKLPYRRAEYTLVSHDHFDHNHTAAVEGKSSIVRGGAPRQEEHVSIRGVLASHGGEHAEAVTLFVVELGGLTFVHLSDLGEPLDAATAAEIGPVDVLMVPTGGGGVCLTPKEALRVIETLKPILAIPMHYRTPFVNRKQFPDLEPLESFQSLFPIRGIKARTERSGILQLERANLVPGTTSVCCLAHLC